MIHDMQAFQSQFLEYCLQRGVLKFGEFTLKSGRVSPYFFNAGLFNTGADLAALGEFYAAAIQHAGVEFDLLFGPARVFHSLRLPQARCINIMHAISPTRSIERKLRITARAVEQSVRRSRAAS